MPADYASSVRRDTMTFLVAMLAAISCAFPARAAVTVLHRSAEGLDLEIAVPLRAEREAAGGPTLTRLAVEDWATTIATGRPALPYLVIPIAVPPTGAVNAMIISRDDTSATLGPFANGPGETVRGAGGKIVATDAGEPDGDGPEVSVEIAGIARDVRYARIVIRPVRTEGNVVAWAKRLRIAVRFSGRPAARPARMTESALLDHPAAAAANAPDIAAFRIPRPAERLSRPAALPTATRLRIAIDAEGIYRITSDELRTWLADAGIDAGTIDPKTLRLELRGNEVPLWVIGEDRGFVDGSTAIEFYARTNIERYRAVAPDCYEDPFVEPAVYWLSWGGPRGARIAEEDVSYRVDDAMLAMSYRQTVHAERNVVNAGNDLDETFVSPADYDFWAMLGLGATQEQMSMTFPIYLEAPSGDRYRTNPRVEVLARGLSNMEHRLSFFLGKKDGDTFYGVGATTSRGQNLVHFVAEASDNIPLAAGWNALRLDYQSSPAGGALYMNWFSVTYDRLYVTDEDRIDFRPPTELTTDAVNYAVQGFTTPNLTVYKIVGGALSRLKGYRTPLERESTRYRLDFQDEVGGEELRYIALTDAKKLSIRRANVVIARPWTATLRDPSLAYDYVIIAHRALRDTVRTLADYRASAAGGGYRALLVDVQQVYDEFDDGHPSAAAIKDFITYAFATWREPPRHLLLVGSGTGRMTMTQVLSQLPYVPNLREPIRDWGIANTDAGYGFIVGDDLLPDVYVGRLPVRDNVALGRAIRKIIRFEQSPNLANRWRNTFTFMGGTEDYFASQAEDIADGLPQRYDVAKLYMRTGASPYLSVFRGGRMRAEPMFDRGALWTIFFGHGGSGIWDGEDIEGYWTTLLGSQDAPYTRNIGRSGIFVSMSCFTAAFGDPAFERTLSEEMISANGGASAWFGSVGFAWSTNDYLLTRGLAAAAVRTVEPRTIGAIIAEGKVDHLMRGSGGGVRTVRGTYPHALAHAFVLVGDPALRIAPPPADVVLATSTRTPIRGQAMNVTGRLPESVNGTAVLSIADDRELVLDTVAVAVTNGEFRYDGADFAIPTDFWGTGITLRAHVVAGTPARDRVGSLRLAVASTLVEGVALRGSKRDSLYVVARIADADGIYPPTAYLEWDSQGNGDSVPMRLATAPDFYETVRPFDLTKFTDTSATTPAVVKINVIDMTHDDSLWTELRFYPNRYARLSIDADGLRGATAPELAVVVANAGNAGTDSVDVSIWTIDMPRQLVARRRIGPLAARPESNEVLYETVLRGRIAGGTGSALFPQVEVRLPIAESYLREPGRHLTLYATTKLADGRTADDTSAFVMPANWGMYPPPGSDTVAIVDPSGRASVRFAPGSLSGPSLVVIDAAPFPANAGQADIRALGAGGIRIEWRSPVTATGPPIELSLAIDTTAAVRNAIAARTLRVGRWNDQRGLWEIVDTTATRLAPDGKRIFALTSRDGIYALLASTDGTPPSIEVTAVGQAFSDSSVVGPNARFLAVIEDLNGVSTAAGSITVTIDGVPLPDSTITWPTQTLSPTALPVTIRPGTLLPRAALYSIRVAARDAAGNSGAITRAFRIAETSQPIFTFYGNFPNPFGANGTSVAWWTLSPHDRVERVELRIYDVAGRTVLKASNYDLSALYPDDPPDLHRDKDGRLLDSRGYELADWDSHELVWTGRNGHGESVANGPYFGLLKITDMLGNSQEHVFTMVKAE